MAKETPKLKTQIIDIKPVNQTLIQPRISVELTAEELLKEQILPFPFFRPLSHRKESTWVISVFVILHLIAFAAMKIVNDCWRNSHQQCVFKQLGRFSFQPLSENPLLGPSASSIDAMGALRERYIVKDHQFWRLFTSPCLHAGLFHLLINLSCIVFVGVHMEQEFGSLRIGLIHMLSSLAGSSVATLFHQDRPSVTSSGALFGLLGAMLSGLIWNWKFYTKKFSTIVVFFIIWMINAILGFMPYVNNFSNIGGFISGLLAGFMFLFKPQMGKACQTKGGIFEYNVKNSIKIEIKQKLDKPVLRSVSLVIFSLLAAGVAVTVLQGVNMNKYCSWCHYIDCAPLKWWSCSDKTMACEKMISLEQLTLTCSGNGKFRVLPFANISEARIEDLCNIVCS